MGDIWTNSYFSFLFFIAPKCHQPYQISTCLGNSTLPSSLSPLPLPNLVDITRLSFFFFFFSSPPTLFHPLHSNLIFLFIFTNTLRKHTLQNTNLDHNFYYFLLFF